MHLAGEDGGIGDGLPYQSDGGEHLFGSHLRVGVGGDDDEVRVRETPQVLAARPPVLGHTSRRFDVHAHGTPEAPPQASQVLAVELVEEDEVRAEGDGELGVGDTVHERRGRPANLAEDGASLGAPDGLEEDPAAHILEVGGAAVEDAPQAVTSKRGSPALTSPLIRPPTGCSSAFVTTTGVTGS